MNQRPKLLLAEDHVMVAEGLATLLGKEYEVLGVIRDGANVVGAFRELAPDLLLLDLTLPNRSGLDILSDLNPTAFGLKVLVVTMHTQHTLMDEVFRLGALGFIPKDAGSAELREAVAEVLAGRRYVSPAMRTRLQRGGTGARVGFLHLTPRQQEVVRMLGHGMTSDQIAESTGLSPWTVHFHRKSIRKRLGLHSDAEMKRYAILVVQGDEEESSRTGS